MKTYNLAHAIWQLLLDKELMSTKNLEGYEQKTHGSVLLISKALDNMNQLLIQLSLVRPNWTFAFFLLFFLCPVLFNKNLENFISEFFFY